MRGFWGDLFDQGAESAKQAINREAQQRLNQSGESAHIQAQNEVGAEITRVVNAYRAGQIDSGDVIRRIQNAATSFAAFCAALGYARAIRGAGEISSLASQLIADVQRDGPGGGGLPGSFPSQIAGMDVSTIAILGLVGFLLLKGRR